MNYLEFLIYGIPLTFVILSRRYMLKLNKLKGSGMIPYIVVARKRQTFFLFMAILSSALITLVITQF